MVCFNFSLDETLSLDWSEVCVLPNDTFDVLSSPN